MVKLSSKAPLIVWFITDDKPGHLNQLKGLASRLGAHTAIKSYWISVSKLKTNWFDVLFHRFPSVSFDAPSMTRPDMVVGAGHQTHKHILAVKQHFNCFSVVLMKPSLPVRWFDAAIIPEHDSPVLSHNVLVTTGVLNNIIPKQRDFKSMTPLATPKITKGLILIGGESKHYDWNDQAVFAQLEQVVVESKDVKEWVLSNSRRTPDSFLSLLKEKALSSVKIVEHQYTDRQWLPSQMAVCDCIWVTPDSVSMVYESLTSGVPTSLFKFVSNKPSRVVKGVNNLVLNGQVMEWPKLAKKENNSCLWEADRAAIWVFNLFNNLS